VISGARSDIGPDRERISLLSLFPVTGCCHVGPQPSGPAGRAPGRAVCSEPGNRDSELVQRVIDLNGNRFKSSEVRRTRMPRPGPAALGCRPCIGPAANRGCWNGLKILVVGIYSLEMHEVRQITELHVQIHGVDQANVSVVNMDLLNHASSLDSSEVPDCEQLPNCANELGLVVDQRSTNNRLGMSLVFLSTLCFAVGNALVSIIGLQIPVMQIIFLRGSSQLALALIFIAMKNGSRRNSAETWLGAPKNRLLLLSRAVWGVGALITLFAAFQVALFQLSLLILP
jgi:hypothetical protein